VQDYCCKLNHVLLQPDKSLLESYKEPRYNIKNYSLEPQAILSGGAPVLSQKMALIYT